MPRRNQPEDRDRTIHHSLLLPDVFEESESLAQIRRWLEMADAALEPQPRNQKQIA